ncbi:peroxisome membrane protein [Basidiobolus meristosporus CBS 931.73]|uniref:Peroxisomal membrane protein PEX16 n=1 Tax=Basidiobolus meristosporus CBS 931.73 TaxID=1314790 RepID=A0A1Y1YU21_9FUNG|nr:peroxisome membrane protein [Basidiobolus meristosporus CBS 931.73]|eukprot:ORY01227.1 peroxisome membrane protein [Basidiobolus meristosporus CBS 931.73]
MEKYEEFILKNASQVSGIESFLRSLTYVLPGRFNDSEFASEALFAFINLLGLYHDKILVKAASNHYQETGEKPPSPSNFNRYVRYLYRSSDNYRRASIVLTVLQYTEVLIEMGIQKKWGKDKKWNVILFIEGLKAALRFSLVHMSGNRTLISPPHPEREVDPSTIQNDRPAIKTATWTGSRTGQNHPAINTIVQDKRGNLRVTDYVLSKVLDVESARKPLDLIRTLSGWGSIGEILFIIRPVLYAFLVKKYGHQSWKPWIISLLVEYTSHKSTEHHLEANGGKRAATSLEQEEHKRRQWLLIFYLLRGPFYEKLTKPQIQEFCKSASKKPIISLFSGVLQDYMPLWENIYFYTSAS